jgi:uncharacterized membrane protein YhaH (DUF805 family)
MNLRRLNRLEGRINRRNWVYGMVILNLIIAIFTVLIGSDYLILVSILPGLFAISHSIRRLHDIGLSGWFWLIIGIPVINFLFLLFLALKKGQDRENKYGPVPSPKVRFPAQILGED